MPSTLTLSFRRVRLLTLHIAAAALLGLSWTSSIASAAIHWQPLCEPGCGGWIVDLSVSPFDSHRLLVSGDMLGIGVSSDAGDSWNATFGLRAWECGSFTWHPTDPNTVWVGMMCGPYVSHDGGVNWQEKRAGMPTLRGLGYAAPIEKILFDGKDPSRLLAFAGSRRHWDFGPNPQAGIVWESTDSGESWHKLGTLTRSGWIVAEKNAVADKDEKSAKLAGVNFWFVQPVPGSDTAMIGQADEVGMVRSDDAGRTWQIAKPQGLPPTGYNLALHPKDPNVLWAATDSWTEPGSTRRHEGGLYKSTDGGKTFVEHSDGLVRINQKDDYNLTSHFGCPVVSPSNPNWLYVSDIAWNRGIVYKSEDGGLTWKASVGKANIEQDNSHIGALPMFVLKTATPAGCGQGWGSFDPKDANVAYMVNSEFIARTRDGGKTWDDATSALKNETDSGPAWRGRGYSGWCSWNFSFNPYRKGQSILQGMDASRGWLSNDNLQSWTNGLTKPNPWFGGHAASFSKDGHIFITSGQGGFWGIGRSRDAGATWDILSDAEHGLPKLTMGGGIEPLGIYVRPDDSSKVWAVVDRQLATSTDGGEHWSLRKLGDAPSEIIPDLKNPDHFYITGSRNVYETVDGGKTFKSIGGPKPAGHGVIDSQSQLYVVSHEGERGGLYRYRDHAWERVRADHWMINVAVDPTDPNRLIVCTNQNPYADVCASSGVWVSADAGKTWSQANDGLAMLRGYAVAIDPFDHEQLIYGSYGRGFFKARWSASEKVAGTDTYQSNPDDVEFCANDEFDGTPTRKLGIRNGSMTAGSDVPDNWTGRFGDCSANRDTAIFHSAPASLRVSTVGDKSSGQQFQSLDVTGGTTFTIAGWFKTDGQLGAQVAVQCFDEHYTRNDFHQVKFLQNTFDWQQFQGQVTLPDWASHANVLVLVEGQGSAWLDDVKISDLQPPKVAAAQGTPNGKVNPPAGQAEGAKAIIHMIRDFGPANFDYNYGSDWHVGQNITPAQEAGVGFIKLDTTENGGSGIVLNGSNIVPEGEKFLAIRAKLIDGNQAGSLQVNIIGSEKKVDLDLTKLNTTEFSLITAALPEDGKYDKVKQIQLQGTNWSPGAKALKIEIDAIGTTSAGATADDAKKAAASDPTSGPPAADKPAVPAPGFYPAFPQAWMNFHNDLLKQTKQGGWDILFFGDSITEGWANAGKEIWAKRYAPLKAANYGRGGDSTRQVLWRITNGEIDGLHPKLVVLLIGTNNLYGDFNAGSDEEVAAGVKQCVSEFRKRLPDSKILVVGLLPRQNDWFCGRVARINAQVKAIDDGVAVRFLDIGDKFISAPGKVRDELYVADKLHLTVAGYQVWAEAMQSVLEQMIK